VVKNNLPVKPEMYKRRVLELARFKGMEVRLNSLVAGAYVPQGKLACSRGVKSPTGKVNQPPVI
jgi:hypothetical protein